jgi:hypothetical protein
MKDDLRAGPEDYKQLAERCAEIASDCSEPTVAAALRALALDYLRRVAKLRRGGTNRVSTESPSKRSPES